MASSVSSVGCPGAGKAGALTEADGPRAGLNSSMHDDHAAPGRAVQVKIDRWVRHYEATREDGEEWTAFTDRVGTGELEELVKDLSMPVDFGLETMSQFIDWNRNVPFEVIRGEGECAV